MRNIFKALIVFIALLTSFCFLSHTEASSNLYSAGYIKNDIPCEKIIANVNTASEIISKDSNDNSFQIGSNASIIDANFINCHFSKNYGDCFISSKNNSSKFLKNQNNPRAP